MSWLLLAVGAAHGADEATYERLFPADSSSAAVAPAPARSSFPSPWRLAAPALLGAVGLVAAWRLKRAPTAASAARPIVVLGRQPLGDRSALVLVEVAEPDGERRRLLVGTGASAPTLVADLGTRSSLSIVDEVLAEREAARGPGKPLTC